MCLLINNVNELSELRSSCIEVQSNFYNISEGAPPQEDLVLFSASDKLHETDQKSGPFEKIGV